MTTARHLGSRTMPDGEDAVVLAIIETYDGEVDEIWDAVTSAERIPRWFLPVTGDLAVGGRYQLEGNAGGEVLSCEPPRAFGVTWEFGGDVSWVEVELTAVGGGRTRLELRHIAKPGPHWDRFGPGAVGIGWDLGLHGLRLHLESGGAQVDAAEVATWTASQAGLAFMRASSEGWYAADVAHGTDEADARRRADATYDAYTAFPDAAESPETAPTP
jgi:uncharacterized protein YndB with AHSA1/START domain